MPALQLVISPAATNDLKEIYQYGLCRWGEAQTDNYLEAIKDQFWLLTEHPLIGIERPELLPNCRSLSIQSHIVFYRVLASHLEIIRILHSRQDPQRQCK